MTTSPADLQTDAPETVPLNHKMAKKLKALSKTVVRGPDSIWEGYRKGFKDAHWSLVAVAAASALSICFVIMLEASRCCRWPKQQAMNAPVWNGGFLHFPTGHRSDSGCLFDMEQLWVRRHSRLLDPVAHFCGFSGGNDILSCVRLAVVTRRAKVRRSRT